MQFPSLFALQTNHNLYVSARDDHDDPKWIMRQKIPLMGWETFNAVQVEGGMIALRTNHGKYVSARPASEGYLVIQVDQIQGFEKFVVKDGFADNGIALFTNHGRYVSARNASPTPGSGLPANSDQGFVLAQVQNIAGWEQFKVVDTAPPSPPPKTVATIPYAVPLDAVTFAGVLYVRDPADRTDTDGIVFGAVDGDYHIDKDDTEACDEDLGVLRACISIDFNEKKLSGRLCTPKLTGGWNCPDWTKLISW